MPIDNYEEIVSRLDHIERENHVRVIYACESGSRAWGFPSLDSDYDVRFIYVHPTPWYLGISQKRDVIEVPVGPILDINGWDVRKALSLLRKSNGPLLEWLTSPLVYRDVAEMSEPLRDLAQRVFMPKTVCCHYLAMARSMVNTVGASDLPRIKTYLYALRSVLCCLWIIDTNTQPPVLFRLLYDQVPIPGAVRDWIDMLLERRARGGEKEEITRLQDLDDYLSERMAWIAGRIPENPPAREVEAYDRVFRMILKATSGERGGFCLE
jgi:hypothetical protein